MRIGLFSLWGSVFNGSVFNGRLFNASLKINERKICPKIFCLFWAKIFESKFYFLCWLQTFNLNGRVSNLGFSSVLFDNGG